MANKEQIEKMKNRVSTTEQTEQESVSKLLQKKSIEARFNQVLGSKAPTFMASIVNATKTNPALAEADPSTVVSAGAVAATLDLPIDSNLGFAAIVPYYDGKRGCKVAQFQMMWKGFVQLAIRTGQYKTMNVAEVYEDELKLFNPITGGMELTDPSEWEQRSNGEHNKIIGYYGYFELISGFSKGLYMTKGEVEKHAKKYSKSYKKGYGLWKDDFDSMAKKTIIKQLISKWGVMSIEMRNAVTSDQAVFDDPSEVSMDNPKYLDNKSDFEYDGDPEEIPEVFQEKE